MATDTETPVVSELARARALLRDKRFAEALIAGNAVLAGEPGQREALLFVAVAQRNLGRIDEALGTLATLERLHPQFSRLHEERGHCYVHLRQAPQAIDAFLTAVNLSHALPTSWRMLEGLYRMTGQTNEAAMAASHVARLKSIPSEVVTATGLYIDGDLDAAEALVRAHLLRQGNQVEAMRLLARIGVARKVFDDAERLLAAVLERAPDYDAARREYADVLVELHRYAEARHQLDRVPSPGNPAELRSYRLLQATIAAGLGEHERALESYRGLLEGTAADAEVHLSIAHALKTLGRREQAIESYRRAAACRPSFGDAYWSLANLKTYRFTADELDRLRAAEADPAIGTVDRYHLCFALGKALEDREEFAESFSFYEQGNALKRAQSNYRPDIIETNTRQQIETCTREFFASRRACGAPDRDPIFIVGLPRSGSTLVEQILASHSLVEGTQELANVQQIVGSLRGPNPDLNNPRYPRILSELKPEVFRRLGEHYIAGTRVYRTGRLFFIDKMPNNFRHLGLIHLMLPQAKIIDARREPLACCFGNLKQLFAQGQEFAYSVADIARYYRTYLELMAHWNEVLPGRILRVIHEDLVADLEGNVRRILDHCELEFEPQCLEFHKTERSVRTASSEQVRQPIYREGLDQWRRFEPWLAPLKEALGEALVHWRT